ncbi:MAG: hypothetical protein K6A92_05505 [Lachnospiraceae bacterium]|nr:hypothetical protein [Lachnospiraceae bacterium]
MNIAVDSIVTVYADIMAFVLVMGLLYMCKSYKVGRDKRADKLFVTLCLMTLINAASNGASYALHHQSSALPAPVRMILPTIAELSVLYVMFLWLLYVDYKIYSSWDRIDRVQKIFFVPVLVVSIAALINLFTGFMFTVDETMMFIARPPFYVLTVFQYAYGILPVVAVLHYVRLHGKLHFFHITPVVVPVVVAALFTLFTDYSARAFGFAVGLVFLHFSYINKWQFDDVESGFYNRHYLDRILELCAAGKRTYKGALQIRVQNPSQAIYDILRQELPKGGELIRTDEHTFLLFTPNARTSMLSLLSCMIEDAAEDYTLAAEGRDDPGISIQSLTGKKQESTFDFVTRVANSAEGK